MTEIIMCNYGNFLNTNHPRHHVHYYTSNIILIRTTISNLWPCLIRCFFISSIAKKKSSFHKLNFISLKTNIKHFKYGEHIKSKITKTTLPYRCIYIHIYGKALIFTSAVSSSVTTRRYLDINQPGMYKINSIIRTAVQKQVLPLWEKLKYPSN